MTAWQVFLKAQGIIWQRRGVVGFLYIFNVLMALLLTVPVSGRLDVLARSELSDHLLESLSLDYLLDFWLEYRDSFHTLWITALAMGVFYLLMNLFFAGGILATLEKENRFILQNFALACGRYAGRFFRLFLLSLIVLAALFLAYQWFVTGALGSLIQDLQPGYRAQIRMAAWLFFIPLLGVWNMIFDYAKIVIQVQEMKSSFKAFLSSLGFIGRYPLQTLGLYFLNYMILLLLFLIYIAVSNVTSVSTLAAVYGMLGMQQLFILLRMWIRVSFFASQQHFYLNRKAW